MAEPSAADGSSVLSMNGVLAEMESYFVPETPPSPTVAHKPSRGRLTSMAATSKLDPTLPGPSQFDGSDSEPSEAPQTPRAAEKTFDAPTDTAIAQHVESIHVPQTVARDFFAQNENHRPSSPAARPASSGPTASTVKMGDSVFDRPRRTLTLKEQNAKIDTLAKENFDLKLKIHFLDQALQTRSENGVKDLIEKNVQLQTDLANERKESNTMRRKMREMEQKIIDQQEALAEAQQQKNTKADDDDDPTLQAEMHEEILYLRQQLDHSENQVTTLRDEVMTKEFEKRKMADHMRSMAGKRGEDTAGMKETMDMWQDLLNAETGRREQAEEDVSKLRDELNTLRLERASPAVNRSTKFGTRRSRMGSTQSPNDDIDDEFINVANDDEAKTTIDQLKHENAELRRDLGAQTSMLTSRNRERERLQQEIEDLKLLHRKGDGRSVAGESIFDRSVSRAHQRSQSRTSDHTAITEAERDEWDKKEGQLRDANAELRIKYQELDRKHKTYLHYVETIEGDYRDMETEIAQVRDDLVSLQNERDETLKAYDEIEADYAALKQEALSEIHNLDEEKKVLEADLDEAHAKHEKTAQKLHQTADDYKGLQGELREITQSVLNLEDEKQHNMRSIQTLEQQIAEAEEEIQKWEQKCNELDQKNRKLEITEESLHNEITFLREEQEGDKIKIGELEDALNAAQQTIQDEQEKLRELEASIIEERQQRDVLENKSKEEVQKVLDDLNAENAKTKDEVRKLRRALSAKEVEAGSAKQRLEELEQALRQILGNEDGGKQSLLADIEKLQRELETTANDLDRAKMDLSDKDRLLRHRDGLLESTSLESRRLSDLLDKERTSRKHDLEQFEKASRGQATHMRTIAQQESRMLELETAYTQDKRKMAALDQQYREQLHERNNLLLALWNRLSTLCGSDWAQHHALVNGETPSVEVISKNLNGFNKNIISAVKTVEALIGSFKGRIRSIEKDLWRDYQTLEHNLDMRMRRMDQLENAVQEAQRAIAEAEDVAQRPQANRSASSRSVKSSEEVAKLKSELKLLKGELKFHRQHPSAMAQQMINQQAQLNPDHARRQSVSSSPARHIMSSLLRHHSTSAVEQLANAAEEAQAPRPQAITIPSPPAQPTEQRWVHRLKELERRLKAEREARLLDRRGARQRLEEADAENEELRKALERAHETADESIN
ncbi:Anucleate primary sterigmata B [Lecanosticta acicola]|uniref:Anucleate primary sterigmata B n=1 Tax=Lecanosticta acicola TaxID=111012 RepID=A0AAI8YZF9_9PEZI|nr:Anucleate primary sterigmata B [Lecanosticta acicola]